MRWRDGVIHDCVVTRLELYSDSRGWLAEFFRQDELTDALHPVMGYLSMTLPGVARGPHEHVTQTDLFVFFSGQFRLYLWDTRPESPSLGIRQVLTLGKDTPATVLVPPGVVHAYRNTCPHKSLIINCPNALYAGPGKRDPVDEIRHEDTADHNYMMD